MFRSEEKYACIFGVGEVYEEAVRFGCSNRCCSTCHFSSVSQLVVARWHRAWVRWMKVGAA